MSMKRVSVCMFGLVLGGACSFAGAQFGGSSCNQTSGCGGSCIPEYSCVPRPSAVCGSMTLAGTSGNFEALGTRCGDCTKYVMGIPVTAGACGGGCITPCPGGDD